MNIRPAYCAGQFYPADAKDLREMVEKFLSQVQHDEEIKHVSGLIVPHAGYLYSGQTAAFGYRYIQNKSYETVVVCSPSHTTPISGISVFDGDCYETPLGRVPVNREKVKELSDYSKELYRSSAGHLADSMSGSEHSLEVQLPFLQVALGEWDLVPLVFNEYNWTNCRILGKAIASVFDPERTLFVASSDLYHGYDYDQALRMDQITLDAVKEFDAKAFCEKSEYNTVMACGAGPISALLMACAEWKTRPPRVVTRTTSADVTKRRSGYVVGYAAVVIEK